MHLFQTGTNLIMGRIPESLALLIFGLSLIVFTVAVRKVLSRWEQLREDEINLSSRANR